MRSYRLLGLLCVICLFCTLAAAGPTSGVRSFKITESNPEGWTLEYTHEPVHSTTLDIDGIPHTVFSTALADPAKVGEPQLPFETFTLGIPFDASVTVTLLDPLFDVVENQNIAPVPGHTITAEQEAIEVRTKNGPAYSQSRLFPLNSIEVGQPYTIRQQRMVTVRLWPYQYNPATKTLKRLLSGRLKVNLTSGKNDSFGGQSKSDPHFEDVYKSLVCNYDQAKQWRRSSSGLIANGPDPTRDWFETGRTYYRIKIAQDGWYKVTTADLEAAGANTAQIDPGSLKLYGNGEEIPLVIRPDTSVEFYAVRNSGDSTYLDLYSDTSHYWLTWGGGAGLRFTPTPQPGGTPSLNILSSQVTQHVEQNLGYYQGTTTIEIIQNGEIPGEGWRWDLFYPNTTLTENFTLDSVFTGGDTLANIRVRLFGTTVDSPGLDHNAKFWMNDSLIGSVSFNARTGVTYAAAFPLRWLVNGNNRLKIQSIPTANPVNQFYLDWFEVDYSRKLKALNSQIVFSSPQVDGGSPAMFTVSGFTNSQIEVYDLDARRAITGGGVSGDSLTGFSIGFQDTFSVQRKYLVVSASGAKAVPPLSQKVFSDIRVNPQGADYVIITHSNFRTSAQQLASHRESVNAVRAKVIDVQDIYDEFNYGIEDWTALKSFIRFAYQNWPAPVPSNLLLFGDACWDNHAYLPTTIKNNFVPAYGLPAGDNWFGCLDSVTQIIPSLFIGRIPVEDSIQAQRMVAKLVTYDSYPVGEWNKNFLLITGGTSPGEQSTFNSRSESTIDTYVTPAPIGGTPFRVYKSTDAVIDGENKALLRKLVKQGLVFMNFLGHSGGRIWGVDIGSPYDLENTDGKLPFVSSVSCNVGAFAEPSNNVLGEDFILADNRGSIATWASSSLGYPTPGWLLMNNFFAGAIVDSLREFGALTSMARYRLWQGSQTDPIVQAMVSLNPLIGDPLSRFALPTLPDFNVSADDISLTSSVPTPNDSSLSIKLKVHNWGLVPSDSLGLAINDVFGGSTTPLVDMRIPAPYHNDSLVVPWYALDKVGRHTLTVSLDPQNSVSEANELNNAATSDHYIYANLLAIVKPLNNQVMLPGAQALVVTSPVGRDSIGFRYFFELDTVATFDSPFLVSSGLIVPGQVKGEWTTPILPDGGVFFWRTRTVEDSLFGNWVISAFSTASNAPSLPRIRLREATAKQFNRDKLFQSTATDSGVTIASNAPLQLYCRSLSYRANLNIDYYSIIRVNDQTMTGLWWVLGRSFMVTRVDEFTGNYDFRAFDVAGQAAQRDSMKNFIKNTPQGSYLAMSVIFDGRTNVNESLYVAIESIGSTMIRSVTNGSSWAFIGRKGYPAAALESMTNDSAIVSLQVPNYYSLGSGSVTTPAISVPTGWDSLHWGYGGIQGVTSARVAVLGIRQNGIADTLRIFSEDSTDVNLASLRVLTSGPTYNSFKLTGLLASHDATYTPAIKEWQIDLQAAPDLAVSSRTVGEAEFEVVRGTVFNLPVTVYNIGFRGADSARLVVSVYDKYNKARPIAYAMLDSIAVNGSKSTMIPISTENFSRRVVLQVNVAPSKKSKDLVADNNNAYYVLNITGLTSSPVKFYADGVQLMDGDYVSANPTVLIHRGLSGNGVLRSVELFVDGIPVQSNRTVQLDWSKAGRSVSVSPIEEDPSFAVELSDGRHELKARLVSQTEFAELDTVEHSVTVAVSRESKILQLFNYPNPFSRETYFTFTLTGLTVPEALTIRVFTVAGRRIREIEVSGAALQIGFNRVLWDGLDSDGDEIGNGYYFYQVAVKSAEGKTVTGIEKLVKLR